MPNPMAAAAPTSDQGHADWAPKLCTLAVLKSDQVFGVHYDAHTHSFAVCIGIAGRVCRVYRSVGALHVSVPFHRPHNPNLSGGKR